MTLHGIVITDEQIPEITSAVDHTRDELLVSVDDDREGERRDRNEANSISQAEIAAAAAQTHTALKLVDDAL